MKTYLTEQKLGLILKEIKPDLEFIYNKAVPGATNQRFRPDYRCERKKLIIEFDGYAHYCKASQIINDMEKDQNYELLGYKIVRIPYFIQMTTNVLFLIFAENIPFQQVYEHGFVDSEAVLPADFCELGLNKFLADLQTYAFHRQPIIESLKRKIAEKGNKNLVLPPSMQYLVVS